METTDFEASETGYYGEFGGAYIPDCLRENVINLEKAYREALKDPSFRKEFDELMQHYVGRPTPLYRADRLSKKYGAEIYLKREDLNHTGAHKINNAIGQVLLAKRMGKRRIIAETGAGQHGVATATVCALMDMECTVYMGEEDVKRQQPNVQKMEMLGAKVVAVTAGSRTLKEATDQAISEWCNNPKDTYYVIGSAVGPHPYPQIVARFQSIISEEMQKQLLAQTGRDYPDYIIACVGGGSNAAGAFYHYLHRPEVKLVVAEAGGKGANTPYTAATLTIGTKGVIHGSRTLVMQDEKGNPLEPYSISAGLDYPGIGPLHAFLSETGRLEVHAITDDEALRAAYELTAFEGIIPALESSHALAVLAKKQFKPTDVVVVNLSGRGDKDMETYLAQRSRFIKK